MIDIMEATIAQAHAYLLTFVGFSPLSFSIFSQNAIA